MNPASFTFECHGADGDKISNALSAICDRYRLPTDISDLVFASQLAEAENTLELIASNREARDFRASVYGSLNDSYPVISDSVIDYYGRWKALAYMARGQCAPVVVTASSCGGRVVLKLSNERRYPTQGTLSYSVIDRDNRPLCSESLSVGCDALSSVTAADIDLAQIISGRERECYLYFEFSTDSEKELSKGTHLFTKPKYFKYKKPTINTEITGSGSDFALLISADCYVGGVALSFCDADAVFEDNYFDITSKSPLRISFSTKGSEAIDKLKRGLVIKSIYDIGK